MALTSNKEIYVNLLTKIASLVASYTPLHLRSEEEEGEARKDGYMPSKLGLIAA